MRTMPRLPSAAMPNAAALNGTVTDDGLPNNTLTITWSKVSGPGTVTFSPMPCSTIDIGQ